MKVQSTSIIIVDETSKLRFSEPVLYDTVSGISVEIRDHDKDNDTLVVIMNMEVENLDVGTFETEKELLRLVNLLSWKHNLFISKYRTTGYQHSETKDNTHVIVMAETLHITATVSALKTVGSEGIEQMSSILEKEYAEETADILLKWRDVLREESPIGRLILMFQILEGLYGTRKGVDTWIRQTEPNIELRMSGRNGDEEVCIYTYLRDCVHAKPENQTFPFSDVEKNIINFQALFKKALYANFPDLPSV